MMLGIFLCVSPWLIRNKTKVGSYSVSSLTGWNLMLAHNEFTFRYYPYRGSIDESGRLLQKHLKRGPLPSLQGKEMDQNRWFRKEAWKYIHEHPGQTFKRGVVKILVNFLGILSPLQGPLKNTIYFISYWILTLLAFAAIPQVWKTDYFKIFLALIFSQSVLSFIFWAHTSHRSFLDPMLAVMAGIGLKRLWTAWYNPLKFR